MKKIQTILSVLTCIFCFLAFPGFVHANQGRFSIGTNGIDCEGISIWQNGTYRISGICNGLVYPYHDQQDVYIFWVQPDAGGKPVRLSKIENGYIAGATSNRFTGVFITVENDSGPRTPSTTGIASGAISPFNFPLPYQNQGTGQTVSGNQPQPSATATPTKSPTPTPTPVVSPNTPITPPPSKKHCLLWWCW